jgi:hypothetical protein
VHAVSQTKFNHASLSSNMAWGLAAIAVLCASTLGADATASMDGAAGITTVVASVGGSQGELAGKDARRCVQSSIVSSTMHTRVVRLTEMSCSPMQCLWLLPRPVARPCLRPRPRPHYIGQASKLTSVHLPLATHGLPWPCSPRAEHARAACRALPRFACTRPYDEALGGQLTDYSGPGSVE